MTAKPSGLRVEITEDSQGDYRWTLYDGRNVASARGCVGYESEQGCLDGLRTLGVNIKKLLAEDLVFRKSYDPVEEKAVWSPIQ